MGWMFRLYRLNLAVLSTICVICAGVATSSYGEAHFNIHGVILQTAAIICEGIRLMLIEVVLLPGGHKMDPLTAIYYFAPTCVLFCGLVALLFEGSDVFYKSLVIWGPWTIVFNSAAAFLLNVSAVFLIRHTSSLTLSICGMPKALLTIAASALIWGESLSLLQIGGFFIASAGLVRYSQLDITKTALPPDPTEIDAKTVEEIA